MRNGEIAKRTRRDGEKEKRERRKKKKEKRKKILLYLTITNCSFCKSKDLELLLDLGKQPPANSLRKSNVEELPLIDLKLMFCNKCALIQISEIVDPKFLFQNYEFFPLI